MNSEDMIKKRIKRDKQLLIDQLRKTPIVETSCQKIGLNRSTYYRWRTNDSIFAILSDEALEEGSSLVNDLAESQLISAITDKNLGAIIFWLKSHHPKYTTKMELKPDVGERPANISEEEVKELSSLLYNSDTFKQGQELLISYVLLGKINERHAFLILRIFLAQMKVEDIMTRKTEAEVMSEVMLRKKINKRRKK